MKTRVITPNLIQLTKLGFVNAYLVREEDGFTVVDTTMGGAAGAIVTAARAAGGGVRRIALTHGHDDHVGSLDALKAATDAPVYMPEIDMRIVSGAETGYGKPPGGWKGFATRPEVLIGHGDRIGSLEVIASPGHTPGHVSFLDTRDRALITGDALVTFGGVATAASRHWRFPLVGYATWDKAKAAESARTLAALSPSLIAAGHGKVVREPASALTNALR
jgi:glyoxylase-like metal-dependent hydrolase (beta-lactamase superfamily II)